MVRSRALLPRAQTAMETMRGAAVECAVEGPCDGVQVLLLVLEGHQVASEAAGAMGALLPEQGTAGEL